MLGKDFPGAVRIKPAGSLSDTIVDEEEAAATDGRQCLRFSLAGVQLKLSAILESTGGLTIPAGGRGGHWILKLPSNSYAHPEAEFSMLALAQRTGILVPETQTGTDGVSRRFAIRHEQELRQQPDRQAL